MTTLVVISNFGLPSDRFDIKNSGLSAPPRSTEVAAEEVEGEPTSPATRYALGGSDVRPLGCSLMRGLEGVMTNGQSWLGRGFGEDQSFSVDPKNNKHAKYWYPHWLRIFERFQERSPERWKTSTCWTTFTHRLDSHESADCKGWWRGNEERNKAENQKIWWKAREYRHGKERMA